MKYNLSKLFFTITLAAVTFLSRSARAQASYVYFLSAPASDIISGSIVLGQDGGVYHCTITGGSNGVGSVVRIDPNTFAIATIHTFTTNGTDGQYPSGQVGDYSGSGGSCLIQGVDGYLYGTTDFGGDSGIGTVYKLSTNGLDYHVLYSFTTSESHPARASGILQGHDGYLYGTTSTGGTGHGTVFRLGTNSLGPQYTVLRAFGSVADGDYVLGGMIQGRDGFLYGTTTYGVDVGTLFRIGTDGGGFTNLHSFSSAGGMGYYPVVPMTQGQDGSLYGVTANGGTAGGGGVIFKIGTNGGNYTELHSFPNPDNLACTLLQDDTGLLFGSYAGVSFYTIQTNGSNFTAYQVPVPNYNANANGGNYVLGPDGTLYSAFAKIVFGFANVTQTFSLKSDGANGGHPTASLAVGAGGVLYGAAEFGGGSSEGTVFKINPDGTGYATVRSFLANGVDGEIPDSVVFNTADGSLYGTAANGGTNGAGTVFKLSTTGSPYSTLHNFLTNGIDGKSIGPMILGKDGNLYGLANLGGSNGVGLVFSITTAGGSYTILHNFSTNGVDGQRPTSIAQGSDGTLYVTTTTGGGAGKFGSVYKMATTGANYTLVRAFPQNASDGAYAKSIVQASDGMLYGATSGGGSAGDGTLFKMDVNGNSYSILHTFTNSPGDGLFPNSLMQASDGFLYGTTSDGGTYDGTLYKISPNGSGYTIVHNFDANIQVNDGLQPNGPLVQGSDGALYGTTATGGTNNNGTVFRFAISSGRFSSFARLSNKTSQLTITAAPINYRIDASTDLHAWTNLITLTNSPGTYTYIDTNSATLPQRFYRMHSNP